MIYAIRTARAQRRGYEVYRLDDCTVLADGSRLADGTAVARFRTFGEASRFHSALPRPGIYDHLRDWRERRGAEPDPSPQLLAAFGRVDTLLAEAAIAQRAAGQGA